MDPPHVMKSPTRATSAAVSASMKRIAPLWYVLITGAEVTASVSDEVLARLPLVAENCTEL